MSTIKIEARNLKSGAKIMVSHNKYLTCTGISPLGDRVIVYISGVGQLHDKDTKFNVYTGK